MVRLPLMGFPKVTSTQSVRILSHCKTKTRLASLTFLFNSDCVRRDSELVGNIENIKVIYLIVLRKFSYSLHVTFVCYNDKRLE